MIKNYKNILISLFAGLLMIGGIILAGELTNTSPPAITGYTLEDIYGKLTDPDYTETTKTDLFPSVSTESTTMRSLSEIWDVIPSYKALDGSTTTVETGIYEETIFSEIEADLLPENIATGTTIFGVTGTFECVSP